MFIDSYGNVICNFYWTFRLPSPKHPELYIRNKNDDILIINHRAGSTALITAGLYAIGAISKETYDDPNFLFWDHIRDDKKLQVFRFADLETFQTDRLEANTIYMVINSNVKTHIIRKLNHCKKRSKNNLNVAIEFLGLCNVDEGHNDYSDFHYISLTSLLRQLKINPEQIKFVDISKIEDFAKMFFEVPYLVPRNVSKDEADITWDDLTSSQQEELLKIYHSDCQLFEKIKSNALEW